MKPDLSRWSLRRPNAVILIVGAPGSGKSVLAYGIADALHADRPVYCPMSERFNRPDYYRPLPPNIQDNSVYIHTDASLSYLVRRSTTTENVTLDQIQAIRRHRNVDLIWDVQSSGNLDVDILRATDCLVLKEPSVLQSDFERPALRRRYDAAEAGLEHKGVKWELDNAWVFTHKKNFLLEDIELPPYWNPDISTDDQFRAEEKQERGWRRLIPH